MVMMLKIDKNKIGDDLDDYSDDGLVMVITMTWRLLEEQEPVNKNEMIFMITVMMVMVITKTWRRRIIVCNGNSDFHWAIHSELGRHSSSTEQRSGSV